MSNGISQNFAALRMLRNDTATRFQHRGHDDVIKWKYFPLYWPFVWGIHRSPVNSPHKGQWRGALMFSLIHHRGAGDLRRHRAHYDVIVMERLFHTTTLYSDILRMVCTKDVNFAPSWMPAIQERYLWTSTVHVIQHYGDRRLVVKICVFDNLRGNIMSYMTDDDKFISIYRFELCYFVLNGPQITTKAFLRWNPQISASATSRYLLYAYIQ